MNKAEESLLIKLLKTIINIETPSSKEGPAIRFITDFLDKNDVPYKLQHIEGDSYNVIINPVREPKLVIASHIDTVQPYLPLKIEGDFIIGRGACDVKSGVAILLTLSSFLEIPDCVSLVILSQEETSGAGSIGYLKEFLPKHAIVIEPTDLKIANVGYGYIEAKIILEGEAHHPNSKAAFNPSKNPILRLFEVHKNLTSLLQGLEFTYTGISSSGSDYSTPESVEILVEIMIPPNKKASDVASSLIEKFTLGSVVIEDLSDGFETFDKKLIELMKKSFMNSLEMRAELSIMRAWTDTNNFASRGVNSIVFGPGSLEHAHSANEKVKIGDVFSAYKVLKEVLTLYHEFL